MLTDLLVTAIVDFAQPDWGDGNSAPRERCHRAANSMLLGRGGDVRCRFVPYAFLAARERMHPRASVLQPRVQVAADHAQQLPDRFDCLLAGRLHDTAKLRDALQLPPATQDAAIYAHAWLRWGEECDTRINGDYAAILWARDDKLLRLARSPLSRQPLHLWRDGNRIIASSTPRAIFAAGVASRVDDDRLADLLFLNLKDPNASRYAGLSRIGPGHVARHRPDGSHLRRYWSAASVPPVRFARDEDYVEATREQLRAGVSAATADADEPAILLSGGLDSQTVAAFVLEGLPQGRHLHSFTATPASGYRAEHRPDVIEDESAAVQALAAMYPALRPEFVQADPDALLPDYDKFMLLSAWPAMNEGAQQWVGQALRLARQSGCDAMLCGDLGNAAFSFGGETAIAGLMRSGRWRSAWHEIRASRDPRGIARRAFALAVRPNLPLSAKLAIDGARGLLKPAFGNWNGLDPEFARGSGVIERARAAGYDWHGYIPRDASAWRRDLLATFESEGAEISLGLELLHGVPLRDPLAYRPLVELCAGMPDDQFLRHGTDRWLARRVVLGKVPDTVRLEQRMGRQSADWPLRFAAGRASLLADMHSMEQDPRLAHIFDFAGMARDLAAWDGTDRPRDGNTARIAFRIARAVMAARFVRHVEGRNAG